MGQRIFLGLCLCLGIFSQPLKAQPAGATAASGAPSSSSAQRYVTYSTDGAVAGAVIGLGTLALVSEPMTKKRNVAIGASLGLYAGILMASWRSYSKSAAPADAPQAPPSQQMDPADPLNLGAPQKPQSFLELPAKSSYAFEPLLGLGENFQVYAGFDLSF